MPRMFYSSKYAHDEYRSVLVDSRVGINQTPESIQSMNDLLVPLIRDKTPVHRTHLCYPRRGIRLLQKNTLLLH